MSLTRKHLSASDELDGGSHWRVRLRFLSPGLRGISGFVQGLSSAPRVLARREGCVRGGIWSVGYARLSSLLAQCGLVSRRSPEQKMEQLPAPEALSLVTAWYHSLGAPLPLLAAVVERDIQIFEPFHPRRLGWVSSFSLL